ncbi:hypothetical protein HaLaN_33194, partial [Haematococcus lacustris]
MAAEALKEIAQQQAS